MAGRPLGKRGLSPPSSPEPPPHRRAPPTPQDWALLTPAAHRLLGVPLVSPSLGVSPSLSPAPVPISEGHHDDEGCGKGDEEEPLALAQVEAIPSAREGERPQSGLARGHVPSVKRRPFSAQRLPQRRPPSPMLQRRPPSPMLQHRRPPSPMEKRVPLPPSTMLCGVSLGTGDVESRGRAPSPSFAAFLKAANNENASSKEVPPSTPSPGRPGHSSSTGNRQRSTPGKSRRGYPVALVPPSSKPGSFARTGPARPPPPHSALGRSQSAGLSSSSDRRIPLGAHLRGSSLPEARDNSCLTSSWLTSEATALAASSSTTLFPDSRSAEMPNNTLDYSNSVSNLQPDSSSLALFGNRVSTPGMLSKSVVRSFPPTESPGISPIASSSPQCSFVLGLPLGQTVTEGQKLEVSAVIPQVSTVDFHNSAQTLVATEEGVSILIDDTAGSLGVSATTSENQSWMPGNEKWQRLSASELSKSSESLTISPSCAESELPQKAKTAPAEFGLGVEAILPLSNRPSGSRSMPAGSMPEVSEHALRNRRGILSASPMLNKTLPTRRFSTPGIGPSTVKVVKKISTPGLKSVEDVLHERKHQALARLDNIPSLRPSSAPGLPSSTLAQLTAGLQQ